MSQRFVYLLLLSSELCMSLVLSTDGKVESKNSAKLSAADQPLSRKERAIISILKPTGKRSGDGKSFSAHDHHLNINSPLNDYIAQKVRRRVFSIMKPRYSAGYGIRNTGDDFIPFGGGAGSEASEMGLGTSNNKAAKLVGESDNFEDLDDSEEIDLVRRAIISIARPQKFRSRFL